MKILIIIKVLIILKYDMKKYLSIVLLIFLIILNACCKSPRHSETTYADADTLELKYAEGFDIVYHLNYKELIVYNPWLKNEVLERYFFVDSEVNNRKVNLPADGMMVSVPIQSLAATSSTHFEFLELLGVIQQMNGVCSPELIYNEFLRKKYQAGELENLGDAFNINLEKTLQLNPSIVLMSGFKQDDPYAERVKQAGLPVIYNNEWMESNLLARAEWIKFVAVFFDKSKEAEELFETIENNYLSAKELAEQVHEKPKILTGTSFRGTWYMPGGKSFMAQLYADAGADYFYADDDSKGSLPLSIETVMLNFSDADVWLNTEFDSLDELAAADKKHTYFKPLETKQVYNFNKRKLASGANDFWESAVARPDLLLLDVIAILHPDILPDHELMYAKILE